MVCASCDPVKRCPFSTLLGERAQGVHAQRIFGYAFNDIAMTIIAAAITSYFYKMNYWKSLFIWFAVGEFLHYVMGVDTAFLETIGLKPECSA